MSAITSLDELIFRPFIRFAPSANARFLLWQFLSSHVLWRERAHISSTRDGIRMNLRLPDQIQNCIWYFGIWEPNLTAFIRRSLAPDDILIDVGANVGYHTLLGAKYARKVYAIEASPSIFVRLQENIALNGFENIQVYNIAVSDKVGKLELFNAGNSQNLGATTTRASKAEARGFLSEGVVDAAPLDQIVPRDDLLNARIIKIDVEGAESHVISGIEHLLPDFSPMTEIVIELNRDAVLEAGSSLDNIFSLFADHGFSAYELVNDYSTSSYLKRPAIDHPKRIDKPDFEHSDIIFCKQSTRR